MAVDPREIEAMERLRRIMNGEQVEDSASDHLPTSPISGGDVDATADMKRILEAFNKGSDASLKKIREEARENRQLRDALITERQKTVSRWVPGRSRSLKRRASSITTW